MKFNNYSRRGNLAPPPTEKLNCRLLFLSFIFFVFASVFAPAAYAAGGNLTQDTSDGYYLIEDTADLAAFRDGVNKGTYTSSNARLTDNIDLSEYSNWTPIGMPAPHTPAHSTAAAFQ